MDAKKEMTIEELEKEYAELSKEKHLIEEELKKKKQEEENRRVAQLAIDKEKRKKEVDEAFENYMTLIDKYLRDYGEYTTVSNNSINSSYLINNPWAWWF